jgi:hypothetical protein
MAADYQAPVFSLPVAERFVGSLRQRIGRFSFVAKVTKDPGGFLGYVPDNGGGPAAAPPFAADFDVLPPPGLRVEFALADQELDEVFQAGTEPAAAARP